MVKFILLQNRRLLFGTFFLFLSGLVFFATSLQTTWLILLASVIFAAIMMALAVLGIALFPRFRSIYEILGVLSLIFAVLTALSPGAFAFIGDTGDLIAFMIAFAVIEYFLYGHGQHKLPAPSRWQGRSHFTVDLAPEDVWQQLVPNPEDPGRYYSGTLKEMTATDGDDEFRVLWNSGGSSYVVHTIKVTENTPFQRFAYSYEGLVSEQNSATNSGTWMVTLCPDGTGGTQVEIVETVERTRIGFALFLWFDNLAAQVTESASAVLMGRKDRSMLAINRQYVAETS